MITSVCVWGCCHDIEIVLICFNFQRMITVFLAEKEAPSKELSMSIQVGWVQN